MTQSIKTNERELSSKIAEWFNNHIQRQSQFPFTEATNETGIKTESTTRFGDIILWKNRETKEAITLIELKTPFGQKENLNSLRQKAGQLTVNYVFTWDFQNLTTYKVSGTKLELLSSEPTAILKSVEEWLRGDKQAQIKARIQLFCEELTELLKTGKTYTFQPEKIFFVQLIRTYVNRLIPKFELFIQSEYRKEQNKKSITDYAVKQGIAFPNEMDFIRLVTRQHVYGLVTKIIFYMTIRRYFQDLPDLLERDSADLNQSFKQAFLNAAEKDWQSVFLNSPVEELGIPESVYDDFDEFFSHLKIYHFGQLPEDVLSELFEEIIDPDQRHTLGQYFTPETLVDFIIGFVVNDPGGIYGDPTCGSGTFLIRLYDRLKFLSAGKKQHHEILDQIWGFDIAKFPAELSTINLFRQDVRNFENFPKIICSDVFDLHKGKRYPFPPPNAGKVYHKIELPIPAFQALVGNFPFIRQELIEKKVKGYKQELTLQIAKDYLFTSPELFEFKKSLKQNLVDELQKTPDQDRQTQTIRTWIQHDQLELTLSGQADIYAYLYLHTATLLNETGQLAIITSNSWLDVSYGGVMKTFFLKHFKVKAVIASWADPWFDDASVNTVVTILEKEPDEEKRNQNSIRFVKLKQKLDDLIPFPDLKLQQYKRWERIDALVRTIEHADLHKSLNQVTAAIQSVETPEMRIRLVSQSFIGDELKEKGDLAKWGKYLRAPDVYFDILEVCKDKLVPLKTIADVRRGYTTGINDFFYLEPIAEHENGTVLCRNKRGWEGKIETSFLRKVIKSPKEAESIIIDAGKLKQLIFLCDQTKDQLRKSNNSLALAYINWGETQSTEEGVKWNEVSSVTGRKEWWFLQEKEPGRLLLQMVTNDRFASFVNEPGVHVDHNLFEFLVEDKAYFKTADIYLNSFFFALIRETNSRTNLGDGATKTEGVDWNHLMLIPKDPINFNFDIKKLSVRPIESVFKEIKIKDRIALDTAVLDGLGLDPKKYLPLIYAGLTEMVRERLELPKMRKKKSTQKVKVSFDEIKQTVIKDCLPYGVKPFPGGFYGSESGIEHKAEAFGTTGKDLSFSQFMGHYEVKDSSGNVILQTQSELVAEYAVLAAKHLRNSYHLLIPKDEKILAAILKNYFNYVGQLKEAIHSNAYQKLHDHGLAEKMTGEIFAEIGLG